MSCFVWLLGGLGFSELLGIVDCGLCVNGGHGGEEMRGVVGDDYAIQGSRVWFERAHHPGSK
jgi:hypothetical protein